MRGTSDARFNVSTIERPVSALRQRMLGDMAMRGLRSDTQNGFHFGAFTPDFPVTGFA